MKRFVLIAVAVAFAAAAPAAWGANTIEPVCSSSGGPMIACTDHWYTAGVTVVWQASSPPISTSGCSLGIAYPFVTDTRTLLSCSAAWSDGTQASYSVPLNVETSSPTATVAPARPPDSGGWYNHAVPASVNATAFSGIASCTSPTYGGPNNPAATFSATCMDNAGKTVAATSAPFAFDVTPPWLSAGANPGDQSVQLGWQTGGNLAPLGSVTVARTPGPGTIYSGTATGFTDTNVTNGVTYTYTITARDVAGNASTQTLTATPAPHLIQPVTNASVKASAPPTLTWTPVRGATYYNVQLYRAGGKILSMWPAHAKLQLPHNWRFKGHRYQLKPGHYRWFVWPGFGKRSAGHYGHRIGAGSFVVH